MSLICARRIVLLDKSGLSIIECLLVLLIIAIMSALILPSFQHHQQRVQRANAKIVLLELMHAQRQYFADHNSYHLTLPEQTARQIDGYVIELNTCGVEAIHQCVELTARPADLNQLPLIYTSRNEKLNW